MAITYARSSFVAAPVVVPTVADLNTGDLFSVKGDNTVYIAGDEGQFHKDGLTMGIPVNKRVTTNNGLALRQYFTSDTPIELVNGDVSITFIPAAN